VDRQALEHLIRAAGAITEAKELIIIGSQAILGQFPDAPLEALQSMEADVIVKANPRRADLISGVIGELSPFHDTFGYYADGVEEGTAVLPRGWKERLIRVENENTGGIVGWCLEVHDLLISKYVAGREKDLVFSRIIAAAGLADGRVLAERLDRTELTVELRVLVVQRIETDFPQG